MKLVQMLAVGGLVLAAASPALAQKTVQTTTTVTKVHSPLHILPHHNHKICKTRRHHGRVTRKCYYH